MEGRDGGAEEGDERFQQQGTGARGVTVNGRDPEMRRIVTVWARSLSYEEGGDVVRNMPGNGMKRD